MDHLYSFFIQWSPDAYGKDAQEQGFVVVEKDELNMIDNFFGDPVPRNWEVNGNTLSLLCSSASCGQFSLFEIVHRTLLWNYELRVVLFKLFFQIITINEARRRQSFASFEDEEPLDHMSVLSDPSTLFEDTHVEKVLQKYTCT